MHRESDLAKVSPTTIQYFKKSMDYLKKLSKTIVLHFTLVNSNMCYGTLKLIIILYN